MIETIFKIANDSQGVAVWVLVLLLVVVWLKLNHRIDGIKTYIQLQFRHMDEKLKNHRDEIKDMKEVIKHDR